MKLRAALVLAVGAGLAGCVAYVPGPPPPPPPPLTPAQVQECAVIRSEIARQERIAALSPVMESLLVEGAVRLNVHNVIVGLEERAAIEGCPFIYGWNGRHQRRNTQYKV